jgi:hypothetical protein
VNRLLHFSEDAGIEVFHPHVAATSDIAEPLVWAIDEAHSPLYWFPRQCPRITFWQEASGGAPDPASLFAGTAAWRVHAIESGWLDRVREATLFAYVFAPDSFESLPSAHGHWVSRRVIVPEAVEPVGDLLRRHVEAGIELRVTPSLWPLRDAVVASGLPTFSMVRMRNAQPRP